ncbi:TPR end-of-group domain-containing protein [Paraburkholderia caledonica]|uniref:TPR end-of-group domain-containing protein n=1 Tax=Paraburkholderia caledonica TaxID=134536 RepID=UPI0038B97C0B
MRLLKSMLSIAFVFVGLLFTDAIAASTASSTVPSDLCAAPKKSRPTTSKGCCCQSPTVEVNNTITAVAGSEPTAASAPRDNSGEFYKSLAEHIDQVAKAAILSSTNTLDIVKWIFSGIALFLALAGFSGFKWYLEQRKELNDFKEDWVKDADRKIKTVVDEAEDEINEKLVTWDAAIEKKLVEVEFSNNLANYILIAHVYFLSAEQAYYFSTVDDINARNRFGEMLRVSIQQSKENLLSALKYIDGANDGAVSEIVMKMLWNRDPSKRTPDPKIVLKSWIYPTIGWLSKRGGNIPEAIRYSIKSNELMPSDEDALYNLACYYSLAHDSKNSFDFLEKTLTINPAYAKHAWMDNDFEFLRQNHLAMFEKILGPAPSN